MTGSRQVRRVLVCGVGGLTGGAVLRGLAERDPALARRALVHTPRRGQAARASGATEVAVGDFNDAGSVARAMVGVDAVYFIPPSYEEREPEFVAQTIRAAESAGVERFVFHSVLHAYTPSMPHHRRKAEAEVIVRSSALCWTILQPAMYAQTVLRVRGRSESGFLDVPYSPDSRFTVIDADDIGSVGASVVLDRGHAFAGYELAGAEMLTVREMGAAMDRVTGERREVRQVEPEALPLPPTWTRSQRDEYAAMCAEYDAHGLVGGSAVTTMLLGRAPADFESIARRELEAPKA